MDLWYGVTMDLEVRKQFIERDHVRQALTVYVVVRSRRYIDREWHLEYPLLRIREPQSELQIWNVTILE